MSSRKPIGIFDSGIGGLSVLAQIRALLPAEDLLYVADTGHLPYGNKSPEFVLQRSLFITRFLIEEGAKAIVVACNTATAAAIACLRERFELPIIGMEPGVKPGIEQSANGRVAILATEGTLGSLKFRDLLARHAQGAWVEVVPCHGWVEQVESVPFERQTACQAVEAQLSPLLDQGVDTLVLGCTHYPFLRDIIQSVAGHEVRIIDTGEAVARQLKRRLAISALLSDQPHPGTERFWSSAPDGNTQALIERLWRRPNTLQPLPAA